MINPFQRLLFCSRQGQKHLNTILLASGPYIHTIRANDGVFLSKWSHLPAFQNTGSSETKESINGNDGSDESPRKRRKLSTPSPEAFESAEPATIAKEIGSLKGRNHKLTTYNVPSVTHLCPTKDGKLIVAVTGEDKCIRVLTLSDDGSLKQLSER